MRLPLLRGKKKESRESTQEKLEAEYMPYKIMNRAQEVMERAIARSKRRALHTVATSSLLNEVVGSFRNLRLTRSNRVDSNVHFNAFTHEQAMLSHAEVELKKARAIDWHIRQKSKMM
jgi:hypothetical protein